MRHKTVILRKLGPIMCQFSQDVVTAIYKPPIACQIRLRENTFPFSGYQANTCVLEITSCNPELKRQNYIKYQSILQILESHNYK